MDSAHTREAWSFGDRLPDALTLLLGLAVLLLVLYAVAQTLGSEALRSVANVAGPGLILVVSPLLAIWELRRSPASLLTPMPWFALACAAFFGLGPLAHVLGRPETVELLDRLWPVDGDALLRTNQLNATGIGATAALAVAARRALSLRFGPLPQTWALDWREDAARVTAVALLIVGLAVKHGLIVPHELGRLGMLLPGSVYALQAVAMGGLVLLGWLSARRGGRWTVLLLAVVGVEIVADLMRLSKAAVVITVAMSGVGRFLGNRRMAGLALVVGSLAGLYLVAAPVVRASRNELVHRHGDIRGGSLVERLGLVFSSVRRLPASSDAHEPQRWWARLSTAPTQYFAIQRYDEGRPGHSLATARSVFVPRMFWPGKPRVSDAGLDLYEEIRGRRHSRLAVGVFGEGYWNAGWAGVLLLSAYLGLLYAVVERCNLEGLARVGPVLLPVVYLGMQFGWGAQRWFVLAHLGGAGLYLAYLMLFWGGAWAIPRLARARGDEGR